MYGFLGVLRHRHKSLTKIIRGFTRESYRGLVICTFLWNKDTMVFLSFINAFNALSRRSLSPLLISPGVNKKPTYLYERTVSNSVSLQEKRLWISLSVLLKLIHLVLSVFIVSSLLSHYEAIDSSISWRPILTVWWDAYDLFRIKCIFKIIYQFISGYIFISNCFFVGFSFSSFLQKSFRLLFLQLLLISFSIESLCCLFIFLHRDF